MDEHGGPTYFVIRVRGVLSERLLRGFPELQSRTDRGDTLLAGGLSDQAALHGVLARIEALSLELLEVRRSKHAGHARSAGRVRNTPAQPSGQSVESDDAGSSGPAGGSSQ